MKHLFLFVSICAVLLTNLLPASAWQTRGHGILSEAAVMALPPQVPAFFRKGRRMVAHASYDPDVVKNRDLPHVTDAEYAEHYFDVELLQGRTLPPTRYEYLKMCAEAKLDPKVVGLLPYTVVEWTERLSIAFAEHRKWPNNAYIQQKCLLYAGFLSHYASDLCMPLHVTVHHNGRANTDGTSPRTGIHEKVDSLIQKLAMKPGDLAKNQKIEPVDELMPAILKEIELSRSHIDRVYELEGKLPPLEGQWTPSPEVVSLATERAREATRFTAALFLAAWRNSKKVKLPDWLERER